MNRNMNRRRGVGLKFAVVATMSCALFVGGLVGEAASPAKPEGEMRWALYVTLSPTWFDPGEVVGVITPFWVLYAIHDALVKPMPGNPMAPSLAESWTVSADQRSYEFTLPSLPSMRTDFLSRHICSSPLRLLTERPAPFHRHCL